MADGRYSYEELMGGGPPADSSGGDPTSGAPPPGSRHYSFEELSGGGGEAEQSQTPATDATTSSWNNIWGKVIASAKAPSPKWMQPYEEPARKFLTTPGLPSAAWMRSFLPGDPRNDPGVIQSLEASYEAARGMATPANAILGAAMVAQPELTPFILPTMTAPMVPHIIEGGKKLLKGEATAEEGGRTAAELAMLALPFVHTGITRAYEPPTPPPPPLPKKPGAPHPELKEITPKGFVLKYGEAPEDLSGEAASTSTATEGGFGITTQENTRLQELQGKLASGEITADEYHKQANQVLAETKLPETDVEAEARAKQLEKEYRLHGGEPEAVMRDMMDVSGKDELPSWQEYADELQDELNSLTKTPEQSLQTQTEGLAKKYGVTPQQFEAQHEQKMADLRLRGIEEREDAGRSREELQQEHDTSRKGGGKGKYASKKPSPTGLSESEVRTLMGKGAPLRQPGQAPQARSEGEQPVAPGTPLVPRTQVAPSQINLELLNRAKHQIDLEFKLPANKAELVKDQEADPGAWPSTEEIESLVKARYLKLLREERIAKAKSAQAETAPSQQKQVAKATTEAAGKQEPAVETPMSGGGALPGVKSKGGIPLQPEYLTGSGHALGTATGKPGLRTSILNAKSKGMTLEEYRAWRDQGIEPKREVTPPTEKEFTDWIKRRGPDEEAAKAAEEEPKPSTFKVSKQPKGMRPSVDEFGNSPKTPVATEITSQGGLLSKSQAITQGKYKGNEALWNDLPLLAHKSHNKIYNKNGTSPDVMAQSLHDQGLIKEPTVDAMYREIEKESKGIRGERKAEATQAKETKVPEKQATEFGQALREEEESGGRAIAVRGLSKGDSVEVDGNKLKVTDVDPDGTVTLEDGRRFGVQKVDDSDILYGEVKEAPPEGEAGAAPAPAPKKPQPGGGQGGAAAAEPPAAPEGKFSTKRNFKKVGEGRYEHKTSGLIVSRGEEGGWDIRHPATGEVVDNLATRRQAMEAYHHGQVIEQPAGGIMERLDKAADAAQERINRQLHGLGITPPTPTLLADYAIVGARFIARGVKDFGEWSQAMIKKMGEDIKPYLRQIWEDSNKRYEQITQPGGVKATHSEASARIAANPRHPDMLVKDLMEGKSRTLDAVDQTILVQHKATLQAARDRAGKAAMNQQLTEGERAEAAATFEDLDSQIKTLDAATNNGNAIRNPQQSNLWHTFLMKDYNMGSMIQKTFVARNGNALTKEQTDFLKKNTDKLSDLMVQTGLLIHRTGWKPGDEPPPGLRDMQYELFKTKESLDNSVFREKLKQSPFYERWWRTGREVLSIPRAIMASMDLSAVRRQGGIFFMSHPLKALAAMPDMIRAARSERAYFDLMQKIRERPNADMYRSSGLSMTDVTTPRLSQMEESYMSQWANHIPLVAHSQRAYVYYLNRLRADMFDSMAKTLSRKGVPTPEQAKVIANLINVFTGRGTVPGQYATAMVAANDAFFAPRYVLSRLQAVTGQPLRYSLKHGDIGVTKIVAGEYARALIGYALVYGLVGTALKGYATIESDPRSTEFGKIKIGNTRIDLLSGLGQASVFLTRIAPEILGLGETKTQAGQVHSLTKGKNITDRIFGDVVRDFFRGKLAPLPAAYWNAREGQTVTGEKTTTGQEVFRLVKPMTFKDIGDALQEQGVPAGVALSLLAILGDSVNTYAPKVSPPRQKHRHR